MAASDFLPDDSDRSSDTVDLMQMGLEIVYQEEDMSGTEEEFKRMEDAKKMKREAAHRRKLEARREKERMEELEKQQREEILALVEQQRLKRIEQQRQDENVPPHESQDKRRLDAQKRSEKEKKAAEEKRARGEAAQKAHEAKLAAESARVKSQAAQEAQAQAQAAVQAQLHKQQNQIRVAMEKKRQLARGPRSGVVSVPLTSAVSSVTTSEGVVLPVESDNTEVVLQWPVEVHKVAECEYQAGGTMCTMRVTLLAAGFVIGARGASARQIGQQTGAVLQSWTDEDKGDVGPCRVFRIQGKRSQVQATVAMIEQAVDKYRELCESKRRGEFVTREHVIGGVQFHYQPPPRRAMVPVLVDKVTGETTEVTLAADDNANVRVNSHVVTSRASTTPAQQQQSAPTSTVNGALFSQILQQRRVNEQPTGRNIASPPHTAWQNAPPATAAVDRYLLEGGSLAALEQAMQQQSLVERLYPSGGAHYGSGEVERMTMAERLKQAERLRHVERFAERLQAMERLQAAERVQQQLEADSLRLASEQQRGNGYGPPGMGLGELLYQDRAFRARGEDPWAAAAPQNMAWGSGGLYSMFPEKQSHPPSSQRSFNTSPFGSPPFGSSPSSFGGSPPFQPLGSSAPRPMHAASGGVHVPTSGGYSSRFSFANGQGSSPNGSFDSFGTQPPEADADDAALCIVCLERPVNACLLTCGHSSFCTQCVENLLNCPLCHEEIVTVQPFIPRSSPKTNAMQGLHSAAGPASGVGSLFNWSLN